MTNQHHRTWAQLQCQIAVIPHWVHHHHSQFYIMPMHPFTWSLDIDFHLMLTNGSGTWHYCSATVGDTTHAGKLGLEPVSEWKWSLIYKQEDICSRALPSLHKLNRQPEAGESLLSSVTPSTNCSKLTLPRVFTQHSKPHLTSFQDPHHFHDHLQQQ